MLCPPWKYVTASKHAAKQRILTMISHRNIFRQRCVVPLTDAQGVKGKPEKSRNVLSKEKVIFKIF